MSFNLQNNQNKKEEKERGKAQAQGQCKNIFLKPPTLGGSNKGSVSSISEAGSAAYKRKRYEEFYDGEEEPKGAWYEFCSKERWKYLINEEFEKILKLLKDTQQKNGKVTLALIESVKQDIAKANEFIDEGLQAFEDCKSYHSQCSAQIDRQERRIKKLLDRMPEIGKSEVTITPAPQVSTRPVQKSFALVVKGGSERKAKEIDKKLKQSMDPVKEKLKVNKIIRTKRDVIVTLHTQEDYELMKNKIAATGLEVGQQEKRPPRLVLHDVDSEMSKEEVVHALWYQNTEVYNNYTSEALEQRLKLLFKVGKKEAKVTSWVIECDCEMRKSLLQIGKVFIKWNRCKIKDFLSITRCFKCQGLWHVARYCKAEKDVCKYCAEDGHNHQSCTKKNEKRKCALCLSRGRKAEHSVTSEKCPTLLAARKRLKDNMDL